MITEDGAKAGGELGGEVDEEEQEEERIELDGLDLRTAKLGDMAEALRRLEREKRSLLDSIRLLRVRLSDEKVSSRRAGKLWRFIEHFPPSSRGAARRRKADSCKSVQSLSPTPCTSLREL